MTRNPARAPSFTKAQLAQGIKADDESRKAKAAAKRAAKAAAKEAEDALIRAAADLAVAEKQAKRDLAAEQEAYLAALRVDAEALGLTGDAIDAYVAEQQQTAPDEDPAAPTVKKTRERTYFGPMLALVEASKTYVKAKNGILCNGDVLAMTCGAYPREVVVAGLTTLCNEVFPGFGTPYSHLNPGQQSMNLRNKTRHAYKEGMTSLAAIEAALQSAWEDAKVAQTERTAD